MRNVLAFWVLVACFLSLPYVTVINASVDPAPILELLNDVTEAIALGDYELVDRLIAIALDVKLPPAIDYLHRALYLRLRDVVGIAVGLRSLEDPINVSYLRGLIYDLSRAYHNLNSSISPYLDTVLKYFLDRGLRDHYVARVSRSLKVLHSAVNEVLESSILRYLGMVSKTINVSIETQTTVYGGDHLLLRLHISVPDGIDRVILVVYADFGGIYSYVNTSVSTGYLELRLSTPSAEDFVMYGYRLGSEVGYRLLVRVFAESNGNLYVGQTSLKGVLKFLPPDLRVVPYVSGSRLEYLMIEALIACPLNTSVYVNSELVATLEVVNGSNRVLLGIELPAGRHSVRVVTSPKAYYVGSSVTYDLIVGQIPPKVSVTQEGVSLGPPFNTLLKVDVDVVPYRLKLVVGGDVVFEGLLNHTVTSLAVQLPWTSVLWNDIYFTIEPIDLRYSPLGGSVRIYVVNIPLLTSLTTTSSVVFLLRSVRKRIRYVVIAMPRYVPLVRAVMDVGTVRVRTSGTGLRRPKLYRLYRKLMDVVSRLTEPPRHHETLREFLSRVRDVLSGEPYRFLALFIHSYELDLYSSHEVNVDSVREVLRRFEEGVRRS